MISNVKREQYFPIPPWKMSSDDQAEMAGLIGFKISEKEKYCILKEISNFLILISFSWQTWTPLKMLRKKDYEKNIKRKSQLSWSWIIFSWRNSNVGLVMLSPGQSRQNFRWDFLFSLFSSILVRFYIFTFTFFS